MNRPAWKIDTNKPGTDLACETAAALASASILFKVSKDIYDYFSLSWPFSFIALVLDLV